MHISEGVLPPALLVGGAVVAAVGVAVGLRRMDPEEIPATGILSAAFFVASLVHVPVGPASVHLILNGLLGLLLGWRAFPAILVALLLQALLFQYGGITVLGVNTTIMALPAVACHYLFRRGSRPDAGRGAFVLSTFGCGFGAVLAGALLVGLFLDLAGEAFLPAAKLVVAAHFPVMVIEGILTAVCALFLRKVRPELLGGTYGSKT